MMENADMMGRYAEAGAVVLCDISPSRFLTINSVHPALPLDFRDPMTQKYLSGRDLRPVEVWWDPVRGKDVAHDGRNRCIAAISRGMRIRCVIILTHYLRPVPFRELSKGNLSKIRSTLDARNMRIIKDIRMVK